jgi:hypothetical protein
MDLIAFLSNTGVRDVGAIAILTGVVVMIFTGTLVPGRTHKRELAAANKATDEWKEAHRLSEEARAVALDQNSKLLAGVRIADKFYRDFLPAADGAEAR